MPNSMVVFFSSDSTDGLDRMLSSFIKQSPEIKIVGLSMTSCADPTHGHIVYSVAMAYEFD
jgi:hypothetical protein